MAARRRPPSAPGRPLRSARPASRHDERDTDREKTVLASRVAELELRVKLLEARVRRPAREPGAEPGAEPGPAAPLERGPQRATREHKPRPRCPGCLLELPDDRRRETCAWCGFVFSAVKGRPVAPGAASSGRRTGAR